MRSVEISLAGASVDSIKRHWVALPRWRFTDNFDKTPRVGASEPLQRSTCGWHPHAVATTYLGGHYGSAQRRHAHRGSDQSVF